MQPYPLSTLIIATYSWSEALELVLLSVKNQSVLPTEVIIADDGSMEDTREMILEFQKTFPVPLYHKWHEDNGFRKTIILNKAICGSVCEYIIQIDGDVILHKHFIKNHLQIAKSDTFLAGSRVWLSEPLTELSYKNKNIYFNWVSKGIKNRFNAMYIPFLTPLLVSPSKKVSEAVDTRGCNMSFWKKDLVAVNGYNEDMTGWGREDSEISVRLVNSGITKEKIKFGAIQYHQHHLINYRKGLNKNDEILEKMIKNKSVSCVNGLSNHC